jgi:hypothetical protein
MKSAKLAAVQITEIRHVIVRRAIPRRTPIRATQRHHPATQVATAPENKSLFAAFSSEKKDSSFFEKRSKKSFYSLRCFTRRSPKPTARSPETPAPALHPAPPV